MSSASAIPDSNPTRAHLRLVVLGQWVRAGLALARGPSAERGLFGGAVALWQVFQAIRLALQLIRRLSELGDVLQRAALETPSGVASPQETISWTDEACGVAACLRQALGEIAGSIRDALALARDRRGGPGAARTAGAAAESDLPRLVGRLIPPPERPPDRPPAPEPCRARWRRPLVVDGWKTTLTPLAALASGRSPLAAPLGRAPRQTTRAHWDREPSGSLLF